MFLSVRLYSKHELGLKFYLVAQPVSVHVYFEKEEGNVMGQAG